jgi:hypothetical protein
MASSSDPIAVIRLQDGILVKGNEALSRLIGQPSTELLGRPVDELIVWLDPDSATSGFYGPLGRDEAVSNLPVAFRTRSWKLWVTKASALPVEIEGRSHALCTVRGTRPPTRLERQIAAHVQLGRIVEQHTSWPDVAETALEAMCQCLDWQAGAVWQVDPSGTTNPGVSRRSRPLPGRVCTFPARDPWAASGSPAGRVGSLM